MIRTPAIPIPFERQQAIENRVREGFYGYIGNEEAVYAIERDLILALADEQPRLARAFLLWGPSSAGKTEMAKRVAGLIVSQLGEIDRREIRDEIEPFLIAKGYITSTERGRVITARGRMLLDEFQEEH